MQPHKDTQKFNERVELLKSKAKEVRHHIVDMVYTAKSGHIGGSMSAADIMTALYFDILNIDPNKPRWADRDRMILSKGHVCPVLYTCLALRGYFPVETLKTLRQFGSILQGHPISKTPGVDVSSGSLGHGFGQSIGIALEGKYMKKDYSVYVVLGNGEIQEGLIWEAASAADKYKLDNLVAIVDDNRMQNDGFTDGIMPMDPIDKKFEAFNWEVMKIDGHNMAEVLATIEKAKAFKGKPVCIVANTIKGKGVGLMENEQRFHGKPPTDEEFQIALKEIRGEV
ncbi:MAG: transketolase [Spirochaetia bacterium]|nr:transketolase [Spirochaetia bacterium]